MTFKQWAVDTAEKAGSTAAQVAIVYILAAEALDSTFVKGLVATLVVALVNVIKAGFTTWMPTYTIWWQDMSVRAIWTFVITAAGTFVNTSWLDLISVQFWQGVAIAGGSAGLAVIKAALAKLRPATISPASLVKPPKS